MRRRAVNDDALVNPLAEVIAAFGRQWHHDGFVGGKTNNVNAKIA